MVRIGDNGQVTVVLSSASTGRAWRRPCPGRRRPPRRPSTTSPSIQGDTAAAPFGPGTGAAAAPFLSGAAPRPPPNCGRSCSRSPPTTRGGGRGPRDRGRSGLRPRHADQGHEVSPSSPASPTSTPTCSRRARRRGWRRRTAIKAPPFTWSNSCHVCTCEVDVDTGQVTLLRYVVSEDCGVMINPDVVEGQIAGGVVQGIGGVLYEHMVYDDDGNPQTTHVRRLPAADRGRGPDASSTATSRRRPRQPRRASRGWARAARSASPPPSSTPSPTPWPTSALRSQAPRSGPRRSSTWLPRPPAEHQPEVISRRSRPTLPMR